MSSRPTFFHSGNHNRHRAFLFFSDSSLEADLLIPLYTWLLKQETHLNTYKVSSLSIVLSQIFLCLLFSSIDDDFRFSDLIFSSYLFCFHIHLFKMSLRPGIYLHQLWAWDLGSPQLRDFPSTFLFVSMEPNHMNLFKSFLASFQFSWSSKVLFFF